MTFRAKPKFPKLNFSKNIAKGITANWPVYESGGTVLHDIKNRSNGVLSVTSIVHRRYGQSIALNGSGDDVQVGTSASIDNIFAGGGTVSTTVRPDSEGQTNGRILSKNDAAGWIFYLGSTQTLLFLQDFSGGVAYWQLNNAFPAWGESLTLTMTYDSSSTSNAPIFYVNGQKYLPTEMAAPSGTAESDAGTALYFGNNAAGSKSFDGLFHSVTFWDRILKPQETRLVAFDPFIMNRFPEDVGFMGKAGVAASGFGSLLGTQRNRLVYGG